MVIGTERYDLHSRDIKSIYKFQIDLVVVYQKTPCPFCDIYTSIKIKYAIIRTYQRLRVRVEPNSRLFWCFSISFWTAFCPLSIHHTSHNSNVRHARKKRLQFFIYCSIVNTRFYANLFQVAINLNWRNPDPLIILRKDRRWLFPFHTCARIRHKFYLFFARNVWFRHQQLSALKRSHRRTAKMKRKKS